MDIQTILSILGLLGVGGIIGSYIQYALNQKGDITKEVRSLNLKRYSPSLRARGRRKFPSVLFLGHETLSNRFSFPLHNLLPHCLLSQIPPKDFQGIKD